MKNNKKTDTTILTEPYLQYLISVFNDIIYYKRLFCDEYE